MNPTIAGNIHHLRKRSPRRFDYEEYGTRQSDIGVSDAPCSSTRFASTVRASRDSRFIRFIEVHNFDRCGHRVHLLESSRTALFRCYRQLRESCSLGRGTEQPSKPAKRRLEQDYL